MRKEHFWPEYIPSQTRLKTQHTFLFEFQRLANVFGVSDKRLPIFKPTTFQGHLRYASANLDLVLPVHKHNSLLVELSAALATRSDQILSRSRLVICIYCWLCHSFLWVEGVACFRIIGRHDYLQAHLFKICLADSLLCPLCKSVPMTREHLSALLHVLSQDNCGVLPARATSALYWTARRLVYERTLAGRPTNHCLFNTSRLNRIFAPCAAPPVLTSKNEKGLFPRLLKVNKTTPGVATHNSRSYKIARRNHVIFCRVQLHFKSSEHIQEPLKFVFK
ncbi:hydroxysteroid dehydrogenase-like protein 1 [Trichonephila clavipes]|nr:hydroxysteroid dehydrogenase-like protein 1 [Trichonephila clavipes]